MYLSLSSRSQTGRLFLLLAAVPVVVSCRWEQTPPPAVNRPPAAPSVSGPDSLAAGVPASFDVTVFDPDGDRLRVYVAWGDGDTTDYGDFVDSGRTAGFEHRYAGPGTYCVSARCHDLEPRFSDWSVPLAVVVTGRQPPGGCG